MKRLLVVLFCTSLATAQVVGPGFVDYVTSAPSGACSQGQHQQNVLGNGQVWTCQSGTWTQVGAGGGGTVTNVTGTANQIDVATGTTTPVISLDAAVTFPGTITAIPCGVANTTACVITGQGGTSGTATITWPAVAGTSTNPIVSSNVFTVPVGSVSAPGFAFNGDAGTGMFDGGGFLEFTNSGAGKFVVATNYVSVGTNVYAMGTSVLGNDVGLSRDSAAVVDVGNGTAGNKTGTLNAANENLTGVFTESANGALSASAEVFSGTPITGGSATTTFPLFYMNATGATASSSLSTSGTEIGINAPSGFTGNFLDFFVNGAAGTHPLIVTATGALTANGIVTGSNLSSSNGGAINWAGRAQMKSPADGVIQLTNNAATGFTRLDFGLTTSSGPAFGASGTTITAQLGDGTAGGILAASSFGTVTNCSSSASPAVCGAAAAGSVALPTGTNPTLVVNTTAVTANSQVMLTVDESLGTKLGVTCNTTLSTLLNPVVTARTGGTSFTFTIGAVIASNPACVSYSIVN